MNWFKKIFARKEQKVWWYLQENVELRDGEYKVLISAETFAMRKFLKDLDKRPIFYMSQKKIVETNGKKLVFSPILSIRRLGGSLEIVLNPTVGERMLKESK